MRKLLVAVLIAAASAVLAVPALAATRSVKVADDYFVRKGSVPTVTVSKGTKVTWRWAGRDMHNVAVTNRRVEGYVVVPNARLTPIAAVRKRPTAP